jgi:hypothetical protein
MGKFSQSLALTKDPLLPVMYLTVTNDNLIQSLLLLLLLLTFGSVSENPYQIIIFCGSSANIETVEIG